MNIYSCVVLNKICCFSTVFIFVSCEEKGYYRVVSLGQLSFDRRSYCGRSCRMQGGTLRNTYQCSASFSVINALLNFKTIIAGSDQLTGAGFFLNKKVVHTR